MEPLLEEFVRDPPGSHCTLAHVRVNSRTLANPREMATRPRRGVLNGLERLASPLPEWLETCRVYMYTRPTKIGRRLIRLPGGLQNKSTGGVFRCAGYSDAFPMRGLQLPLTDASFLPNGWTRIVNTRDREVICEYAIYLFFFISECRIDYSGAPVSLFCGFS